MNESGRYYWLKLKRDFFKRHDIKIIESMPNGKDYILFYLKLLVESVDHDGALRFSDAIPYDVNMLSVVTNTNADIVKSALEIFVNLQLIDILDDKTIFMNEVSNMIGSAADNANAKRQKRFRESRKIAISESSVTKNNAGVTVDVTNSNERKRKIKSIEKEKEKELEKDKNIKNKTNNIFLQMQGDE